MNTIKQFSIFVENKQGKMAELTRMIADAGIDLRTLSLADTRDFGILRIIVNKPDDAEALLNQNGWAFKSTPVIGIKVPDVPGGVAAVLEALNEANVNVEYMYAFVGGKQENAYMVFRVTDEEQAGSVLREAGVRLVEQEEIVHL